MAGLDASIGAPLGPSTDWTGHDVYGHFARWQEQTIADLRRLLSGEKPQPVGGTEDEINERWRNEDREVSAVILRERATASRAELRAMLDRLSDEQWRAFGHDCAQDISADHLEPHLSMIGK
jgi:hypothetical protein